MTGESGLLCDEENFPTVVDVVESICARISRQHNIRVIINISILNECLLKARQTIEYYGSDFDSKKISEQKEAAHIGFWINKLKPCTIASPSFELKTVAAYLSRLGDLLSGESVELVGYSELLKKREGQARDAEARSDARYDYAINENVAFLLTLYLIRVAQEAAIDALSPLVREDMQRQIELMRARVGLMQEDIVVALRYYNFSTRGYASMMDAVTRLYISAK